MESIKRLIQSHEPDSITVDQVVQQIRKLHRYRFLVTYKLDFPAEYKTAANWKKATASLCELLIGDKNYGSTAMSSNEEIAYLKKLHSIQEKLVSAVATPTAIDRWRKTCQDVVLASLNAKMASLSDEIVDTLMFEKALKSQTFREFPGLSADTAANYICAALKDKLSYLHQRPLCHHSFQHAIANVVANGRANQGFEKGEGKVQLHQLLTETGSTNRVKSVLCLADRVTIEFQLLADCPQVLQSIVTNEQYYSVQLIKQASQQQKQQAPNPPKKQGAKQPQNQKQKQPQQKNNNNNNGQRK